LTHLTTEKAIVDPERNFRLSELDATMQRFGVYRDFCQLKFSFQHRGGVVRDAELRLKLSSGYPPIVCRDEVSSSEPFP
jgi:hypothetical protein